MTNLQLAHLIRKLISENSIKDAFKLLEKYLINHKLYSDVIALKAQWWNISLEKDKSKVSFEDINVKQNQIRNQLLSLVGELFKAEKEKINIFISYDRTEEGAALALDFRENLEQHGFKTFIDKLDVPIGGDWAASVALSIQKSDYFILLLSQNSITNEVVLNEVETAYQRYINSGDLTIIPIRVQFPINLPLSNYLSTKLYGIQTGHWKNPTDTQPILQQLIGIFSGQVTPITKKIHTESYTEDSFLESTSRPQPKMQLEVPQGSVWINSDFYIARKADKDLIPIIENNGALIRIRGPRQFGKTSLLHRVINHAIKLEYSIISIDFQELPSGILQNLNKLLYEFCQYFVREFDLKEVFQEYWEEDENKKQSTTLFIENEILRRGNQPVLLAIDEADLLFQNKAVSKDFFLLLRSWHERRNNPATKAWKKFRLVLSYATEVKLAIQDLLASPFNVGEEGTMQPFTYPQVMNLAQKHGLFWTESQLEKIMDLLGGQPYLTRKAMYVLAKSTYNFETLLAKSSELDGPFRDHLRHHLYNVLKISEAKKVVKDILIKGKSYDPTIPAILESVGLIKGTHPNYQMRNELYANCFNKYLK